MALMTKTRILAGGLIVMVVLNLVILGTLWYRQPPQIDFQRTPSGQQRGAGVSGAIVRQLNLDRRQRQQFHQLHQKHMQRMQTLRQASFNSRKELFSLLSSDSVDAYREKRDSLASVLARQHMQMEQAIFNHLKNLRQLCRPDQLQHFDRMLNMVMQRIGPGPAHAPGGRGPMFRRHDQSNRGPNQGPRNAPKNP